MLRRQEGVGCYQHTDACGGEDDTSNRHHSGEALLGDAQRRRLHGVLRDGLPGLVPRRWHLHLHEVGASNDEAQ